MAKEMPLERRTMELMLRKEPRNLRVSASPALMYRRSWNRVLQFVSRLSPSRVAISSRSKVE